MLHSAIYRIALSALLSVTLFNSTPAAPLDDAAAAGDLAMVERLLDGGADVNAMEVVTPLYLAAQRGYAEIAVLLVDRGANINAVTQFGTALQVAARGKHVRVVEILLQHGADPNVAGGEHQSTPLHEAAAHGSVEVAVLLIQHGADVNRRTTKLHPPIHMAARNGTGGVVALLLEHGAAPMPIKPLAPGELAAADVEKGRIRAIECGSCHAIELGTTPSGLYVVLGPHLWNVVGRRKGSLPEYPYSPVLTKQNGNWTYEELNRFLADGTGVLPGTNMGDGFEPDRSKRISLIAYLRTLSNNPVPLE